MGVSFPEFSFDSPVGFPSNHEQCISWLEHVQKFLVASSDDNQEALQDLVCTAPSNSVRVEVLNVVHFLPQVTQETQSRAYLLKLTQIALQAFSPQQSRISESR